jgi:hypothetical protein
MNFIIDFGLNERKKEAGCPTDRTQRCGRKKRKSREVEKTRGLDDASLSLSLPVVAHGRSM